MIKPFFLILAAGVLSGCASLDASHIAGQRADADKYTAYTDIELEKQKVARECFAQAGGSDVRFVACAMMGQSTGIVSTFAGRPTETRVAPTFGQTVVEGVKSVAPYAAAAVVANSVAGKLGRDPVVVNAPEPIIVRPEVITIPGQ